MTTNLDFENRAGGAPFGAKGAGFDVSPLALDPLAILRL